MKQQFTGIDEIERSLQKDRRFHEKLVSPFTRAVSRYELLCPGDQVAVCISGGKDSMLMAKLFQILMRHGKFRFGLEFVVMDPGYAPENRALIEENAKKLLLPIRIFESRIFDAVDHIPKNPCYLCARMRRGYLYRYAKDLGCNKIALGHHYDDVIETILMSMLWAGQYQTMMPKLHSTNFEGMELIRPMYLIREEDIIDWTKKMNLTFLRCACHFTENCSSVSEDGTSASKRAETKQLIRTLRKTNPYVEANLFKSAENVNLDRVIAWKKDLAAHSFLEEYRD
jgi:tRNA(Ile)-lysidine synthase TilS/MesJ